MHIKTALLALAAATALLAAAAVSVPSSSGAVSKVVAFATGTGG